MKKKILLCLFVFTLYVTHGKNVTNQGVNAALATINLNFGQSNTYNIVCNRHNILYISTDSGLLQFDGSNWLTIPSNGKLALTEGRLNNILVAGSSFLGQLTFNKGKCLVDTIFKTNRLASWQAPEKIISTNNLIYISSKNKLWVFHNNSLELLDSATLGLNIFKGSNGIFLVKANDKRVIKYGNDGAPVAFTVDVPQNGNVEDVLETQANIWVKIKYSNQLVKLNKNSFKTEGQVSLNQIAWKKYFKVVEISPNQLLVVLNDGQCYIVDLLKNSVSANIAQNLFEGSVSDVLYDLNGNLWLLQKSGLVRLDIGVPAGGIATGHSFSVILTKAFIDGDSVLYQYSPGNKKAPGTILLGPATRQITFEFTATNYRNSENLHYSFFLEGFDLKWSGWRINKSVTYNNLPPGEYVFKVKAQNNTGTVVWADPFLFSIKAPMYIRWWAWLLYGSIALAVLLLFIRRRRLSFEMEKAKLEQIINMRTAELRREKAKTDELLANLLPKDTADELKNTGKATSQKFNMVTVLFSDIQGFSKIAEQMNPEKLIDELDSFFFHFDSVADKYNIEKIKTIGDAYMCAGGIPYKNRTNPVEVVLAALEMQEYMKQLKLKNNNIWDLRIGIHTGAVIAGVVGHKRYSYDIWGDTVNTASRMESSGEPGKVNISGHTYDLVKDFFVCENRGKMPVKYKGDIDMYFVRGIRPELSLDLKIIPNKKFMLQLQMLRLHDLEEFVIDKLNHELPKNLHFHNTKYTKDIYTLVELIGRAESISQEEMLHLRTAALLLNTGFITNYSDYIHGSKKIAREILPKFKYSEEQIKVITDLIQATQRVFSVSNKQEAILLDASLNYLGRVDYISHVISHYKEIKERTPNYPEGDWYAMQLKLLEQYHFHTETARLLREVSAQEQIEKLLEIGKLNA